MIRHELEPTFYAEHFTKDLEIGLQEAKKMNIKLPGLAMVRDFYKKLLE